VIIQLEGTHRRDACARHPKGGTQRVPAILVPKWYPNGSRYPMPLPAGKGKRGFQNDTKSDYNSLLLRLTPEAGFAKIRATNGMKVQTAE
jgi:hypothetical protein